MGVVLDVMGPTVEILTSLEGDEHGICLMRGTIRPGMVVPLHSHPDRENFAVLAGSLEALLDDSWQNLNKDDIFDVVNGARHAFRNSSDETASMLIATTIRLGRFFELIGRPAIEASTPPSPKQIQHFVEAAAHFGHWLGTPEENAAIGIALGQQDSAPG